MPIDNPAAPIEYRPVSIWFFAATIQFDKNKKQGQIDFINRRCRNDRLNGDGYSSSIKGDYAQYWVLQQK